MHKLITAMFAASLVGSVYAETPNIPTEFGTTNQCYFVTEDEMVYAFYQVGENTFTVPNTIGGPATVLVVGGGGAGGASGNGTGGGGGAVVYEENVILWAGQTFTVTVGGGGEQQEKWDVQTNGGDSIFDSNDGTCSLSAAGGKSGTRNGGASGNGNPAGAAYQKGTYGKGFGGGGGAGAQGGDGNAKGVDDGGVGGIGITKTIAGFSMMYGPGGGGQQIWPQNWYKNPWGWGGASTAEFNDGYGNMYRTSDLPATPGRPGVGGGGGGGNSSGSAPSGGSGCVIIRFQVGEPVHEPEIASVSVSKVATNGVTVAVVGSNLNQGEITLVVKQGETTVQTKKYSNWGSYDIVGLDVDTAYVAELTAANIGGSTNVTCSFRTLNYPWAGTTNTCYRLGKKDWVYIYREPGTYTFTAPSAAGGSVRLLVAGGGGGGGGRYGSGGGGGYVVTNDAVRILKGRKYTVTVGDGGTSGGGDGTDGQSSSFTGDGDVSVIANGGGAGKGGWSAPYKGGQSVYDGGAGSVNPSGSGGGGMGGGGGGAGGVGGDAEARGASFGGIGGMAVTNAIVGTAIGYGYGGGGAGNWYTAKSGTYGLGGALDGWGDSYGIGQYSVPSFPARPGQPGTGGGGGGGARNGESGAAGGCGCVIIRYTEPPPGLVFLIR